ncbi:ArsR/SmtB family transcription factor [Gorillibacterium massiliense]|uniref:ArsR/SmtB family transcription factor n=1 Tax=Gorillibacterium massiliense TaxID=1280390 RepID=UPI0004B61E8E|nr:metalloregulator ArsR/SmtB family transcription factor [Gorillibacterium massiliense]
MAQPAEKPDVFQAIADPTRREVLLMLIDKELPISEITAHFPISRTAVVKHLLVLENARLISGRKAGREKRYRMNPEPLAEVSQWLAYAERFWSNKLSMLQHLVEHDDKKQP